MSDHRPDHAHHQHGPGDPTAPEEVRFTEDFWEERYRSKPSVWSGRPNRHLVEQAAGLEPGRALDVGCGEGADAVWLAERGWQVLAVDWSATALQRGTTHAHQVGADVADRIDWQQRDLIAWDPGQAQFDLVSSQYTHLPPHDRDALVRRLAAAVRPGGTLLIAAHHPSDLQTTMPRPNQPELFYTGDQLLELLEPGEWDVITNDAPGHEATDPDGRTIPVRDTVWRVRRR